MFKRLTIALTLLVCILAETASAVVLQPLQSRADQSSFMPLVPAVSSADSFFYFNELTCRNNPMEGTDPYGLATYESIVDKKVVDGVPMVKVQSMEWFWYYWNGINDAKPISDAVWRQATSKKELGYFVNDNGKIRTSEYLVPLAALGEETKDMLANEYEMLRMLAASGASGGVGPFLGGASILTTAFLESSAYAATYELTGIPSGDVSGERYASTTIVGTAGGTVLGHTFRGISSAFRKMRAAKTTPTYTQMEFLFARGASVQTPGVTTAGERFVRVGAQPRNLKFSFDAPGGVQKGTYVFPESTFNAIGRNPAALKNRGDLPGPAPQYYRILEPPAGTPIQRGIVPGGEFGGVGGVEEAILGGF